MIEYIHGDLTELTPALDDVETAGVDYGLNISLNTYTPIQGKQEVKQHVNQIQDAGQGTAGGIGKRKYDVSQQNNETVRLLQQRPYKSPLIHT